MTPDDLEKHPIGGQPDEDDPLLRELRAVSAAIEHESAERHRENAAREERLRMQREADEDAQSKKDRKTRNRILVVALVVLVDLLLSVSSLILWHRADEADQRDAARRLESRRNLCGFVNQGIDRDKQAIEALIAVSVQGRADAVARGTREPLTPEEQADQDRLIRLYAERQGMRYEGGKVIPATINCGKFALDPVHTKPEFPGGK